MILRKASVRLRQSAAGSRQDGQGQPGDVWRWYNGAIMMARTQITLDRETHKLARQRAAQLGLSLAAYLRQLVTRDLRQTPRVVDPSLVFNLGRSDGADVARRKDRMLGEAVAARREPHRTSSR